jgi:glycosyltransferase involved in cell wall biosynthesis|nr:glycosyltransferase family 1 protein [uncultured Psychroserpens sp.]
MSNKICYIHRKSSPKYFSIENIFVGIENHFSKKNDTQQFKVKFAGGSPKVLFKNIKSLNKNKDTIYHITGDVHYMALATGKKSVLTIHDVGSANQGGLFKKLYIKIFWFWLPALFIGRITVISEFTKHELSKVIPFAKSKIRVVSNYVDPNFQQKPLKQNSKPEILFVGVKPNKNLELSLEAIKDISCRITVIGELNVSQKLLVKKLGLDVNSQTNLTREEIQHCYESCDLLCFASTYEGFGMPIIEAQAIGRPVLTSDIGAMKEVAKNSACLVNPYDVHAIKNAVLKIIEDDVYKNELIKRGIENCERFKLEHIASAYQRVYEEL